MDINVDIPEYASLIYATDEEKVRQASRDTDALVEAAASNSMEGVCSSLSLGVDINGLDSAGQTALFAAAAEGHVPLARFLLSENALINASERNGQTPLHAACMNARVPMVRFLIGAGADLNAIDGQGCTPLHKCVGSSPHAQDMINLLASGGANLRCRDKNSWDLLM